MLTIKNLTNRSKENLIYDYRNLNMYKTFIKKNINKVLLLKNEEDKKSKLFEILDLFLEEFLELSDELVMDLFCEENRYHQLFDLTAEEVLKLSKRILNIDDIDLFISKSDREIEKVRVSKDNNKALNRSSNELLLNSYFDVKDEIDYCILNLKDLLENEVDEKKLSFARKEYFCLAFWFYSIMDNMSSRLEEDIINGKEVSVESIKILESYYEKIYHSLKQKNVKKLKFK